MSRREIVTIIFFFGFRLLALVNEKPIAVSFSSKAASSATSMAPSTLFPFRLLSAL